MLMLWPLLFVAVAAAIRAAACHRAQLLPFPGNGDRPIGHTAELKCF